MQSRPMARKATCSVYPCYIPSAPYTLWVHACRPAAGMSVKSIGKGGKADLLRTVSKKLEKRRLHSGWIERILHARVPILKFNIQGMLPAS